MITDAYPFPPEGHIPPAVKEDDMQTVEPAEAPFAAAVRRELDSARRLHPAEINSLHEGYSIILEELDGWRDEWRKRPRDRSPKAILLGLVQVAAACQRVAEDRGLIDAEPPGPAMGNGTEDAGITGLREDGTAPDVEDTVCSLLLTEYEAIEAAVRGWTEGQRIEAVRWAWTEHVSASDCDLERLPKPAHVAALPIKKWGGG